MALFFLLSADPVELEYVVPFFVCLEALEIFMSHFLWSILSISHYVFFSLSHSEAEVDSEPKTLGTGLFQGETKAVRELEQVGGATELEVMG